MQVLRLYQAPIASVDHIDFGAFGTPQVQQITVASVDASTLSGSFALRHGFYVSTSVPFNASVQEVSGGLCPSPTQKVVPTSKVTGDTSCAKPQSPARHAWSAPQELKNGMRHPDVIVMHADSYRTTAGSR